MSTAEVAKRYFGALAAHDVDAAVACWSGGGVDRFVGQRDLIAPEGVREYFSTLFDAFPDFAFHILDTTTAQDRTAVRWRATGTFAGPGRFEGFEPNGARIELEGCDVVMVRDGLIVTNHAYLDGADLARQLGVLPPVGSRAQTRLIALANLRTRARRRLSGGEAEPVADGVWLVRGGFPSRTMNVYLLADDGGVTVFDAGIASMAPAIAAAAARLGGIRRVVLGHADADHRGAAPGLHAPVFCHAAERAAAESDHPFRDYWRFDALDAYARPVYPRLLRAWDGGALAVEGTVAAGDEVAGFRVVDLPGHAPGLIGLFREADRLALVSDCIYTRRSPVRAPEARARFPTSPSTRTPSGRGPRSASWPSWSPRRVARSRRAGERRCRRCVGPGGGRVMGKRSRQRAREQTPLPDVPTAAYPDAEGNILVLRGSLGPAARAQYARTLSGGLAQEDAWQRAVELLFERLAVSWTLAGLEISRQKELLGRYRMASADERRFVREALRRHLAEHFPEMEAP